MWYKINGKKLPDDEQIVLVCWEVGHIEMAKFLDGHFWFQASRGRHLVNKMGMTHWMSLPKTPKQDKK